MDDDELFGSNVARLREAAGMSQNALAAAMREADATHWRQTTVSRVENGQQSLSVGELRRLAKVLGPGVYAGTEFESKVRNLGLAAMDLYYRTRLRIADKALDDADRALAETQQTLSIVRRAVRESLFVVDDTFRQQHADRFDSDGNYLGGDDGED